MSEKKCIVRLTDSERKVCSELFGKLKGTGQKVRRAQIMLKADAVGPAWTDAQIAEAFSSCTKTVENIRQRFVELSKKVLDGNKESKIIAMRLGPPPQGRCQQHSTRSRRLFVQLPNGCSAAKRPLNRFDPRRCCDPIERYHGFIWQNR